MNKRWLWIGIGAVALIALISLVGLLASTLFTRSPIQASPTPLETALPGSTTGPPEEQGQPATGRPTAPQELGTERADASATPAAISTAAIEQQTPTDSGPTLLFSTNFVDIDNSYEGSGTVTIRQQPDGSRQLRFEDFMVSSGPQLHVLLSADPMPTNHDELGDYVDLGPLKATSGQQDYDIPSDLDLGSYQSVVIYCVPFQVLFTVANFTP